ncbi:lactate utilization protein C [Pontibacillus yanchengensis]|uniref:Lactate utilization protein C n=2 Tax=Pontibacillus yanchengensis TaxID=462910 RepID=A0ACC7VCP3_9BACI|nr:lactate utilization protein C [Pontibacillus yanchengensis]MYL32091.1 lactate utilization protein C [Pontibacillus yanchengensis]MYL52671.1 lactate utilization protein C [Pontibacillus yanchengensis]
MSIQNRDSFLQNVANNLGRPRRTEQVERPSFTVAPQWEVFKEHTQDELTDELEAHCNVIHTTCKRTTVSELPHVLWETVKGYDGKSVIASDDKRNNAFGVTSFYKELEEQGVEFHLWNPSDGHYNMEFAERADVGITFSDITLAESGTVTLFNNSGNGRAISLLPRTYIAIIPKSTLVPRMTQAAKHIHDANQEGHPVSSCVSFITGPSNSADIEMNLIVGVHGPVEVTYIIVE